MYFDELEDESFDLSGKNIPTSQTMNNDRSGGDKLYSVLYTSGSTGSVSYTHLTLPTICSVDLGGRRIIKKNLEPLVIAETIKK